MRTNLTKQDRRLETTVEHPVITRLEEREIWNRAEFWVATPPARGTTETLKERHQVEEAALLRKYQEEMMKAQNNAELEIEIDKEKTHTLYELHQRQQEDFIKKYGEKEGNQKYLETAQEISEVRSFKKTHYRYTKAEENAKEDALNYPSTCVEESLQTNKEAELEALQKIVEASRVKISERRVALYEERNDLENADVILTESLEVCTRLKRRAQRQAEECRNLANESRLARERTEAHNAGEDVEFWSDNLLPWLNRTRSVVTQTLNVLDFSEVSLMGGMAAFTTLASGGIMPLAFIGAQATIVIGTRAYQRYQEKEDAKNRDKNKEENKN